MGVRRPRFARTAARRLVLLVVAAVAASTFVVAAPAAAATITSVTPSSRPQGSTATVTIAGGTFLQTATVTISGSGVAVSEKVVNPSGSQITVTVTIDAAAVPGVRTLKVTNVAGADEPTAAFTVNDLPRVNRVSPNQGTQGAVDLPLTIEGEYFQTGAVVSFSPGGVTVRSGSTTVASASQITLRVDVDPHAGQGPQLVFVTNPDGGQGTTYGSFSVVGSATGPGTGSRPTITAVAPDSVQQGTVAIVQVEGEHFTDETSVMIVGPGITVEEVFVASPTLLFAVVSVLDMAPLGVADVWAVANHHVTHECKGCLRVSAQGYRMVSSDGGLFSFGSASFGGSLGGTPLNAPIVGMAEDPSSGGYWMVAADGGVFGFGGARFFGSTGGIRLNQPIVGMAASPSGGGYWLAAADGGIFAFGDAEFLGSMGGTRLNRPVVGIAAEPFGGGYWLVASDGGIFAFGEADFLGSTGDIPLNRPIVGMAASPFGGGYWLVASDGGIFAFGDALFAGSTGDVRLNRPIVGLAPTVDGGGYWLVASDGGLFAFGNAAFAGSMGGTRLNRPVVAVAGWDG